MGKKPQHAPANKETDYSPYEGRDQWWSSDPKGESFLQEAKTGPASYKEGLAPTTIPALLAKAAEVNAGNAALRQEQLPPLQKGEKPPPPMALKDWKTWTWGSYYEEAKLFARACIEHGLEPMQAVNIYGFNSPEWAVGMMGAILAGGKVAGIYPSDTQEQVAYKSNHGDGAIALVEDISHFDKFAAVAEDLPLLKAIVTYGCEPGSDITRSDGSIIKTYNYANFLKSGSEKTVAQLEERLANITPAQPAVLVYTSGTTGNPKAVMLTHDSMIYASVAVVQCSEVFGNTPNEERILSYLPLSHVAGMMVDLTSPLVISAHAGGLNGWGSTNFARTYDLKLGTLVNRLTTVKPTIFLGVPRVYEKMMEKLLAIGATTKGLKKVISTFAKKQGSLYTSSRQLGKKTKNPKSMFLANVILNKIKQKLGLDKAKFIFSGAAPLTDDCINYFGALGISINEAYGMSETCGMATWSTNACHVWGSVGFEAPGIEVKVLDVASGKEVPKSKSIFNATEEQQGEICFRGRNIMMGYLANPRLGEEHVKEINAKNADTIDSKGFLHSGDKGTVDEMGMFKITGRYKELIIGAGGENVAPVPIENELKRLCPFISNVVMIGNKRKFNVVVVTLKAVGASGELPGGNDLDVLALQVSPASKTVSEAINDKAFETAMIAALDTLNSTQSVVPNNASKIQKFTILPRDFSILTGEITPSQKLKRTVIESTFEPIIEKMYDTEGRYANYNTAPTEGLDMGLGSDKVLEKGLSFSVAKVAAEAEAENK